jgi:hypothetical protein
VAKSPTFPHPIGLLLFNRIEYAQKVLESLKSQTLPVDQSKLCISVDGYAGSKAEFQGKPDHTAAIVDMARSLFPNATVLSATKNIGITEANCLIEENMLKSHPDATWLGFFEEDYVLSPDYLSIVDQLISAAQPLDDVVLVAATGETLDPVNRGISGVFPIGHLWAYFARVAHVHERHDDIQVYRQQLSGKSYWERDKIELARVMASRGVFPVGIGDDHLRLGLVFRFNRIGLTTGLSYGEYIGVEGEHMSDGSFARFNFTGPTTVPFDDNTIDLPALVPTLRAQFHAGFAKRLAERFVIPKFRAVSAQKKLQNLSRGRKAIALLGQAFRALF